MVRRPFFDSADRPPLDGLSSDSPPYWQVEIPKPRWRFRVAKAVSALLIEHEPGADLRLNQDYGLWGILAKFRLLETVTQLSVVTNGEVIEGVTISEALWSDRALVTIPRVEAHAILADSILAYRGQAPTSHAQE